MPQQPLRMASARLRLLQDDMSEVGGPATDLRTTHRRPDSSRLTDVTWLILPVVICLSKRLRHASLSISDYTVKLRIAHYISYSLFDGTLLHG